MKLCLSKIINNNMSQTTPQVINSYSNTNASKSSSPPLTRPMNTNNNSNNININKPGSNEMSKPDIDPDLLDVTISQLRNSINEKRLLVKLLKATNLTS